MSVARIAGVLAPDGDVAPMLRALAAGACAGHDDARTGTHLEDGVQLGSYASPAPALAADDRHVVVLDGEIHNRDELAAAAGGTAGGGDAALLCALVGRHGVVEALRLCNGEFAAAIWSRGDRELWLARDRIGVRPLYYAERDGRLAFASRPRPLLELEWVSKDVDRSFVGRFAGSHYRTFDNDPRRSPYRDVDQLPAGHVAYFAGGRVALERWWSLADLSDLDGPPAELAERYRDLLLDAVRLRLRSAQRPAFTLSGGMDSSSVLACAVRHTGSRQHAFSTTYSGSQYDESREIRSMLQSAVEEWHRVPVDNPDVLALVERMVDAHDEPVATATWLSHHVLCGEVHAGGFRSLFGGLGGDELNAGEYEYFLFRFADMRRAGEDEALRHEVREWQRHHDHPIFRKDWAAMERGLERLVDLDQPGRILGDRARIERYRDAVNRDYYDVAEFDPVMDRPFASYLKNRTYQDVFRETAPCCLRAEDRQAAAHGLRTYDPFFDHRLFELMFRVPGAQKIRDGITKRLLRDAMRGLLPDETRERIKKTGWNAPADVWFAGAGRALVLELISDPAFRAAEVYDLREVRRIVDEHDEIVSSGRAAENHMMFLWQLVNLELWLRWLAAI
jgi:asparagine synthase (glutamine-hydrolysing)